ncbi:MAG: hypothetical protein QM709_04295 [Spongiibacteraceae bacterium]
MDSPQCNVVVSGAILDGFDSATVLQQIQQQLKLPEAKARLLIAGKNVTVKRDVGEAVATSYCSRLRSLGLDARIESAASAQASTDSDSDSDSATSLQAPAAESQATYTKRQPAQRYFGDSSLSANATAPTKPFKRAVSRANAALIGTLAACAALSLGSFGLLLFYMVGYAGFLLIPPVVFSATIYFLVSITLAAITALLARPFLPNTQKADCDIPISPMQEPTLFAFIAQICEQLAIKPPTEIVLTTATTNSAALIPGFKNIKQGDYRLALSLPALDNGSLNQCASLIAADLATQTYLPMLRYRWLASIAHDRIAVCLAKRDWLAQRIDTLSQSAPAIVARLCNLLDKLFEQANRYLQKIAARLQKIDAQLQRPLIAEQDRYSALIAGSDRFTDVMIFRARLHTAAHDANEKNTEDRIEGGLVNDLPALIKHYYDSIEDNFAQTLQRKWNAETTPRSDEPPIARERIERIEQSATPALINNDTAAFSLLQQRDEDARASTLSFYRATGLEVNSNSLMPTDELTYTATQDILQRQQATIYFNDWFRPFRFWSLADYALISDMPLQDASMQLGVCVNEIRRLTPDRAKLLAEYERLQNQLREVLIAQHVLAAGKKFTFRYIQYDGTTLVPVLEDRQQELTAVMEKLQQQETVMGGRITLGLHLSGQDQREVHELHDALRMLHDIGARLYKMSLDCFQLEQLLHRHHKLREADYSLPIKKLESKIDDASRLLLVRLNDIPYPLDSRHRSLKSFIEAMPMPSPEQSPSPILQRAQRLIDALYRVNEKFSRQAADYGTIAEEAYRIEPIRLIK